MANEIVPVSVGTPATKSTGTSASRPGGFAGGIFDRLQKAIPAEAPSKPEDLAKTDVVAPPAKEIAKTDTEQALADAGKAPAVEPAKDAKAAPSIRQLVKASNIPADMKDKITELAYLGRAISDSGMTADGIKLLKDQGMTPEVIAERLKMHPTVEDAKRDMWFAQEMRRIGFEYNTDPQKFLLGLKLAADGSGNPQIYANLIERAAVQLKDVAHGTWVSTMTDALKTALYNLGNEAASGSDEDLKTAVSMVQQKFGFISDGTVTPRPAADPRLAELEKQNAEMIARQRAAGEASKGAFLESIITESRNAVYREIHARWLASAPAGLDEVETKRAIDDIFYAVENDLKGVQNFVYDLATRRNGPQTQQAYRDAVKYAFDRALPFIPQHQKSALDFWTKRVLPSVQARDATEKKAAGQVDAAELGGTPPAEPAADTPQARLAAVKGKNLTFQEKILHAMAGGRK
jgi:hypothetical protein